MIQDKSTQLLTAIDSLLLPLLGLLGVPTPVRLSIVEHKQLKMITKAEFSLVITEKTGT